VRAEAIHSGGERTATTTARTCGGKHRQTLAKKATGVKHCAVRAAVVAPVVEHNRAIVTAAYVVTIFNSSK
jgi:hypothetical protein